jgi:hypothetical protein
MSEENPITVGDAQKIVAEERQHRERECMQAIDAVLKEHRCKLNIVEVRVNGQLADLTVKAEALE